MSEWTDIGDQLREAREKKGVDIKDVAHATRIPLATLTALEESNYSIFPSPTYARSFLAQYSEYLGVDAHEWVEAFETGDVLSNVNDHEYLKSHNEHIGANEGDPSRSYTSSRKDDKASGNGASVFQAATVFLITAALIGGGIYAYNKFEPNFTGGGDSSASDTEDGGQATTDGSGEQNSGEQNSNARANGNTARSPQAETQQGSDTAITVTDPAPKAIPAPPAETNETTQPRLGPPPKAMVIEEEE